MSTKQKSRLSLLLALLLSVSLAAGCAPLSDPPVSSVSEESARSYEQFSEEKLKQQAAFSQLEEETFRQEAGSSQIDLHYLLKNPSSFGISSASHLYTPVSLEFMNESRQKRLELQKKLEVFDPSYLTEEQRLTFRVVQSLLKTEQLSDGLELYAQPLAPTIGIQAQLPILLCEYQFYSRQDVEDYLHLIEGIKAYYGQILEFEQQKAQAGLMMSDTSLDHVIESCESYLLIPGNNFMIDTFNQRLDGLTDLTEEEKASYRSQNQQLLQSSFVPAYQTLIDGLSRLKGTGVNSGGLSGFPKGREYYRYLAFSSTGTSMESMEELSDAIEKSLQDSLAEMSAILKAHPNLAERLDHYSYRQTEPSAIMEELKTQTQKDFPSLPECSYTLKDVPKALELSLSPAFYLTSPIDDISTNVIYINQNERFSSQPLYNTIAHEGYPGHLYQTVYFHTNTSSNLRKLLSFSGYTEGWATYVEHQSYFLDNGLDADLAELLAANSLASLGLHAALDLSVNYLGWDLDQVTEYLADYYSDPQGVAGALYQTMIENPSNYLSYYVGCMEFMDLRREAEETLGSRFSPMEFHRFLLDMGSAPFDVIQVYFSAWLAQQKL